MSTVIKVSKSAASESGINLHTWVDSLGFSVDTIVKDGAMLVVTLVEDLNTRQIDKVRKKLDHDITNIYIEVYDTETLDIAKERYKSVVDLCSEARIKDNGFEWPPTSGQRFSLSLNAQIKWLGLDSAREDMTYPYRVPTKDNDIFHSIQDAAEAHNMYLTAVGTIDALLSAGTLKKEEITAALTKAAARTLAVDFLTATECAELIVELGP